MAAEIKKGKKWEHFAIDRVAAKAKRGAGKKSPGKQKKLKVQNRLLIDDLMSEKSPRKFPGFISEDWLKQVKQVPYHIPGS
jgi:hypothetical protein